MVQPFLRTSLLQRYQSSYRKGNYLTKKVCNSTRSTLHKGNCININQNIKQGTILNSSKSNNNTLLGEYQFFNISNSSKNNKCNVFTLNIKENVIQDLTNISNNKEKYL